MAQSPSQPVQRAAQLPGGPLHRYQLQACTMTLAEGLAEYHAVHTGLARGRELSSQAQQFFRCHDVAHVVFGCGTTLDDEAVVKIASLFGTTAGFGVLKGYRLHESIAIYRRLRVRDVLRSIAHAAVVVPRALWRCARQRRRWPWDGHAPYLSMPLAEIRAMFGIEVKHHGASHG